MRALLADGILVTHFLFVLFVAGGLPAIWLGAARGWRWVRNLWFRAGHLAAIVLVTAESLAGIWCPLTVWEDALRGSRSDMGFVARIVHRLLFYSFPEWVFTALYSAFAVAVAVTFWLIPPRRA
jgi:hypothetical protein